MEFYVPNLAKAGNTFSLIELSTKFQFPAKPISFLEYA